MKKRNIKSVLCKYNKLKYKWNAFMSGTNVKWRPSSIIKQTISNKKVRYFNYAKETSEKIMSCQKMSMLYHQNEKSHS